MVAKRNRKREHDRNEWVANYKDTPGYKSGEKKKEAKKDAKEEKTPTKNVILMGAPKQKKEISIKATETKKQASSNDDSTLTKEDSPFGKSEKEKSTKNTNDDVVKNGGSHMNLGRVFFVLTALLTIFLGLGSSLNWFA